MTTSNPALCADTFRSAPLDTTGGTMTIRGTAAKTLILLGLATLSASFSWTHAGGMGLAMLGLIVGGIAGLILCFKQAWAPILAPVYAVFEGLFLGGISSLFAARYGGMVMQAVLLTFGTLFALLAAYQTGYIRASAKLKVGVIAATGGICLVYFLSIILGFFHIQIPGIFGNGPIGIIFSLIVVGIAALNLILDFDLIEQGAASGAPKYMEWYGGFALMLTLVWLYLEILRLLAKLRDR